jgi:hypothetical protein
LVAAALSHFASSSAIRTDFGVKVISGIESPFLMVVGVDRALVGPAIDLDSTRPGARATLVVGRCRAAQFSTELISASR